jgi:hypothetical protein
LRRRKEQGLAVIAALNTRGVFDRNLSALETSNRMQTTLRFDEELMRRIKAEAAQSGMTLTRYIEVALRERLRRRRRSGPAQCRKIKLPVSRARGGLASGIRDLKEARAIIDDADASGLLMRRN